MTKGFSFEILNHNLTKTEGIKKMIDKTKLLEKAGFNYINSGGGCMVYQYNFTDEIYIIVTEDEGKENINDFINIF